MRVLHTVASLHPESGGPARSVPGLAGATGMAGADVHLWAANIPEGYVAPIGVNLHTGSVDDALQDMGTVDLVHDHGLWLPVNHRVAQLTKRNGIPRVVSPRGMLETWALNHKKWKKKLAWALFQKGDLKSAVALHATAKSEADQFLKLGLRQPSYVVPNGVDLPDDMPDKKPKAEGIKTAVFLSRIHPKKGLPMLVEAWDSVRPYGWKMKVIGPDEGGHRDEIISMVDSAGLGDSWEFSESLEGSNKWSALQEADLFVLPTYSENFGIVVAEALAAGVPVITTTGAPWEKLQYHSCGWWTAPEVGSISEALKEATSMKIESLQQMGARGRTWVVEEFAWQRIGERMNKVYDNVLGSEHC